MTSFEINLLSLDELLSIKSRQAIKFVIKITFSIAVTTNFPVLEIGVQFFQVLIVGWPHFSALTCTFHHWRRDWRRLCIPHFPHGTGIDPPQTNRSWLVRIWDGNSYRRNLWKKKVVVNHKGLSWGLVMHIFLQCNDPFFLTLHGRWLGWGLESIDRWSCKE